MLILTKLHNDAREFLSRNDRNLILLSGPAAAEACRLAADAGLSIGRIEGGFWLNPGFESRMDSIWDTRRYAASMEEARDWNLSGARFIESQMRQSPDPSLPPADSFIVIARRLELQES